MPRKGSLTPQVPQTIETGGRLNIVKDLICNQSGSI